MPSWDSAEADGLWTESCGKDRWLGRTEYLESAIRGISDAQLWHVRTTARNSFIDYARERLSHQLTALGHRLKL